MSVVSSQVQAIESLVREKHDSHEHPIKLVVDWLRRLAGLLEQEESIEPAAVALLLRHARPEWGVRSVEEGEEYFRFWEQLAKRYPQPILRAAYANELVQARPTRRCEALMIFTEAVKEQPELFVEYAGEFAQIVDECGLEARRQFELAKIRFYVHLVNRNEMDSSDLQEAIAEAMSTFGDSSMRGELWAIAQQFLRG